MKDKTALPEITPKEKRFVAHYAVHFNGAAAVRFAGFDTPHDRQYAVELLAKPTIQAHVVGALGELGGLHFRLGDENTGRLKAMRDADRTAIFDAKGNLIDPKKWPEECKLLIAGIEVEEIVRGRGDDVQTVQVTKIKLESPKGIIDSLAKISGQFVERTQQLGKDGNPVDPSTPQPIINVTVGNPPKKKSA